MTREDKVKELYEAGLTLEELEQCSDAEIDELYEGMPK